MPKETIQALPDDGLSRDLAIEVAWGRNTWVQLASVNLPLKRADAYGPNAGFYTDLTRPMINKLIRVLRRARDQAFGSDE